MADYRRIPPRIKAFLREAMPVSATPHVLATGEWHYGTTSKQFISQQLPELQDEHNLGELGYELPVCLNIFLWAYRDGNLPVDKEHARLYLKNIFNTFKSKANRIPYDDVVDLLCDAIDGGETVVAHDTRAGTAANILAKHSRHVENLKVLCERQPHRHHQLRMDPQAMEKILIEIKAIQPKKSAVLGIGSRGGHSQTSELSLMFFRQVFVFYEMSKLLEKYPHYQRQSDNLDAVIEAGAKYEIDHDALSAALLMAHARPSENVLSISGAAHIGGRKNTPSVFQGLGGNYKQLSGTFAQQIAAMPLPVTPAIIGSSKDIRQLAKDSRKQRIDMNLPTILVPGSDTIIQPETLGRIQWPGTVESAVARYHKRMKSHQPDHVVERAQHVATMKAKLESPEMAGLLDKLRPPSR